MVSEDVKGNTVWKLDIGSGYELKNHVIKVSVVHDAHEQ